jgi:hypothetical protein
MSTTPSADRITVRILLNGGFAPEPDFPSRSAFGPANDLEGSKRRAQLSVFFLTSRGQNQVGDLL